MVIASNLQYLRKRDKLTQEELAEKLDLSRQSISKWETGEAYPETDKLLILCDLFHVSLDDLLRRDLSAEPTETEKPNTVTQEQFNAHMNTFSRAIAAGIFLILFGVAICAALCGYACTLWAPYANLTEGMGAVAVVLFTAIAVFLFIYFGIKHDNFRKQFPVVENVFQSEKIKAFQKRFPIMIACFVSGILLGVVFLVVMYALIDSAIITVADKYKNAVECYITSIFLFILSFMVGGLVYCGIQHTKFNIEEYNRINKKELYPSPRSKLKDALCGVIMMSATALFLVFGFVWHWWHPAWVVFPVGGILCGIVGTLMGAKDDHDKE